MRKLTTLETAIYFHKQTRDFPRGPVVRGSVLPLQRVQVWSLVRELMYVFIFSQSLYVDTLTPSTLGCDLIWKEGHCRCDWLQQVHTGVAWTLNSIRLVSLWKGEIRTQRRAQKDTIWRLELCCQKAGTTRSFETGLEQVLPWDLQREHDPAHTLISDF